MSNKTLLATALVGALCTTSVAFADHGRDQDTRGGHADAARERGRDVIGNKRLHKGRGEVSFSIDEGMRRDALQLNTNARFLRILAIEFEYSDGRIIRHEGRDVRQGKISGGRMTIQFGRPPGLRHVRVAYVLRRDRTAQLQLVQIGSGYTRDEDLWENLQHSYERRDDGKYYLVHHRR